MTALPADFQEPKPVSNRQSTILGVCITLLSLVYLTTSFRLYARLFMTKTPGWDDLFVVLAVLSVTFGVVTFCVSTRYGMGDHLYLLPTEDIEINLLLHYLIGNAYTLSTAFIKLSLLLQYLRVFDRGTLIYRFTQCAAILVAAWGFTFSFITWFCCFPDPSAFWKGTGKGCYATASPIYAVVISWIEAHAGINMIFDFIVLTIPFRILFLKDAVITKWGMMVLLFMGVITCGFSVWRLQDIVASNAGESTDLTWVEPMPFLLSFVEVCIAAICASTPFFWPILSKQLNKIFVVYEFNVSSEPRYQDDQVELASTQDWPTGTKSTSVKDDVRSLESRSWENRADHEAKPSHYTDHFIQNQVNPFGEEFQTDTTIQSVANQKKKGGFVKFDNTP